MFIAKQHQLHVMIFATLYINIPHVKGGDREFIGIDRYGAQWSDR